MISVLLPFHNAGETIQATLASIRQQSYSQFEVIAIDDHSTDRSSDLVRQWPDNRVRLIKNRGQGLVDALNQGLSTARFGCIARMDADDLMRSCRLSRQFEMLHRDRSIDLVGSRVSLFPQSKIAQGYREYVRWQNQVITESEIRLQRFVESPLAHPSVMFRKKSVQDAGGYRHGDFPEDYELWLRMLDIGMRLEKCPEFLLDWRESETRLSRNHPAYHRSAFDRLRAEYLSRLSLLQQRNVVYWGAGRKTRLRAKNLIDRGVKPNRWIDIDPRKIGNKVSGIAVEAPDYLQRLPDQIKPFVLVYVTNHGARELIQHQLESFGYRMGKDYLSVG